MNPVAVRILHQAASPQSGRLERWLADARLASGQRLASLFGVAGASDVRLETSPPDGRSFGDRMRELVRDIDPGGGLVVLGSGSIPLATGRDAAAFVAVAGSGARRALANNRYSADAVAMGRVDALARVPDLPGDNALPRWLEEAEGFEVEDLRRQWRLGIDLDSPLDALLIERSGDALGLPVRGGSEVALSLIDDRIERVRTLARDRRAELLVAGRTSAATLRWLERCTACRVRALVEERGLRASAPEALGDDASSVEGAGGDPSPRWTSDARRRRPPRSVLGMHLDFRGASAFGSIVAELGDGAIVDTRVLLAHRLGMDEMRWPSPEDRFASDLLLAEEVEEPWLRVLTRSMRDAPIPVVPGGHTVAGPGLRLLLG